MTIVDTDAQRFSLWFTSNWNRQKWTFCISQHLHNNSPCDYYDFRLFLMTQDYRNPFKSRKSTTSMNSINAFADIRVRYPKINEIFKVCQLLCCAQNIVHHYYSYSQKLSNWALLSITTIIRWKEKRTCTYIPFELLGILFSLQIKHIMQSTTTMSYHSIFCF